MSDEPLTTEQLTLQRDDLQTKIDARSTQPGFAENVRDIQAAMDVIDKQIAEASANSPEGDD